MIKIITVYNSLNPGSFLQATALYDTINKVYGDVEFFDAKTRHPFLSGIKLFFKLISKGRITHAFNQLYMPLRYARRLKSYNRSRNINEDDIYILGSDEIWNVSRKNISKYPVFWGNGLNQSRCISYAPSLNNANITDLKKFSFVEDSINNINSISVRDQSSRELLNILTDRKIALVCDPVLLLSLDSYKKMYSKKSRKQPYIMVYGPESHFKEDEIKEIIKFAKEKDYKLLSYYFYHSWVDDICYGDPYEFLEMIDSANYVFTSTFHGTMFSIKYNKKFVSFGENRKVQEILKQFNLMDKKYLPGAIKELLNADYRYDHINQKISDAVIKSKNYLYGSIDKLLVCNELKNNK